MAHYLAPEAERDLDDIAYYIARETGSLDIAERLIDSITSRFYLLASHPRIGRTRDDLLAGARSFPVGNYVIVYDLDGGDVRILRVAHGRRNLIALFGR
jgi:toxin ParE1/3/4